MKNLRITENCLIKGEHTEAGTVLENVEADLADQLLTSGRAVLIKQAPEIENRDPAPENRDPKAGGKKAKETE